MQSRGPGVLLALVFAAFLSSGVTDLKLLGFGLAFAVLLDATLMRGVLVPALVTLAGRWNWWAPAPLARLHRRFGITENGREAAGETGATPGHARAPAPLPERTWAGEPAVRPPVPMSWR